MRVRGREAAIHEVYGWLFLIHADQHADNQPPKSIQWQMAGGEEVGVVMLGGLSLVPGEVIASVLGVGVQPAEADTDVGGTLNNITFYCK